MSHFARKFLETAGDSAAGSPPELPEGTADRFFQSYLELLSGHRDDAKGYLRKTYANKNAGQLIVVRDIDFVAVCRHHALPFFGKVTLAYVPDGCIVGLSKVPRFVQTVSRRFWLQEDLTGHILTTFHEALGTLGTMVRIEARHACMALRGVRSANVVVTTSAVGVLEKRPAAEVLG